jgi:hypothetical protein
MRCKNPRVYIFVSIAVYVVCLAIGWQLGRTEDRPVRGLVYGLFGPIGLVFFWAGRDWRRDRDARRVGAPSV